MQPDSATPCASLRGIILLLSLTMTSQAGAQDTISGFDLFGPTVEWLHDSGLDVAPIHGGLLPNGKLYFLTNYKFYKYGTQDLTAPGFVPEYVFLMDPSPAYLPPPATVSVEPLISPLPPSPVFDPSTNSVNSMFTAACFLPAAPGHELTSMPTMPETWNRASS